MLMRSLTILALMIVALLAGPASAQVLSVETWVEQWDETSQSWVRVEGGERFVSQPVHAVEEQMEVAPIAAYGPFRVLDDERASLVDVTDSLSPRHFAAMLRDYPGIAVLEMTECPGTEDDRANLRLGRMLHTAGIATHVPKGGSVRSGAVELFLAGAGRTVDDGAEFAVHSWIDDTGRSPQDYAADSAENRTYIDYYREMGMDEGQARAFYDMTNSVPFESARWLTAREMRGWLGQEPANDNDGEMAEPRIAYLDLGPAIP